jgi:hypothetical protein
MQNKLWGNICFISICLYMYEQRLSDRKTVNFHDGSRDTFFVLMISSILFFKIKRHMNGATHVNKYTHIYLPEFSFIDTFQMSTQRPHICYKIYILKMG